MSLMCSLASAEEADPTFITPDMVIVLTAALPLISIIPFTPSTVRLVLLPSGTSKEKGSETKNKELLILPPPPHPLTRETRGTTG
jgi:hypothetical protein